MPNSFYNHSTYPSPNAPGSSAALRSELDLITAGFDLLPTLAGNGYKVAMVNAAGTALIASAALQSLAITSSTINSTPIGATTAAAGNFTTLTASGAVNLGSSVTIAGGTINNTMVGNTTPSSGAFTTLSASSGITGNLTGNVTSSGTSGFNNVTVSGTLTGNVAGNVTSTGTSSFANVTITGTLDMSLATAATITGLAAPTSDSEAANKAYVDTVSQGLDAKASCRAATTANITLSGTQTIDGVALIAGDRVLVKDQSTASQNGIYVVAAGSWSRAADADSWAELVKAFTFVEEGTNGANNGFVCTVAAGGTLGSTAVTFVQFSGAGQITAGAGMTKTGNTLNVNTASASRIVVGADEIDLATSGVTAGTYKSVTVDQYGRVTSGTNPTTLAGYGISDAYTIAQIDALFGSTTSAAASASAAATSATNAANSATSASGSATAAANSATAAAASYDSFDDRYLGAKSSDPTLDNDGNALLTGALYFNTTSSEMRVYNGTAWATAYLPAAGYLALAGGTMTGALRVDAKLSLGSAAASDAQIRVANALTGSTAQFGVVNDGTFQSDVTGTGVYYRTVLRTQAAAFTMTNLQHYQATQSTLGAGSAVTNQYGFVADNTLTGATNNFGFRGAIASGTGRWNLYMDGTAQNYLAGNLGIGITTPSTDLHITTTSADPVFIDRFVDSSGGTNMSLRKARGTQTSPTIVLDADTLGSLQFRGYDGASYIVGGQIRAEVDGTPGTNDMPTRLVLLTTADGASSPTERIRVASTGALGFSGANFGTSGQVLQSAGPGSPPTWTTPGGGGFSNIVVFTSSGTWTVPAGVTKAKVTVTGGGGGGSGYSNSATRGASGGGGGGTAIKVLSLSGGSATVTVGSGGGGGGSTFGGGGGGTSQFVYGATTVQGDGGEGGVFPGTRASGGGGASGGDVNIGGGAGGVGSGGDAASSAGYASGGHGGSSFWGANGAGAPAGNSAAAGAYGGSYGGGGGAGSWASGSGAGGGQGIVIIEY